MTEVNIYVYLVVVPKACQYGKYSVYVYAEAGSPHKGAHCHVRTSDGETVLALPTLSRIVGRPLPRDILEGLRERLDDIVGAWEGLNGGSSR